MKKEIILLEKGYTNPCLMGKGSFSEVFRVSEGQTGKHFACKISGHKELLLREAQLLREIRHPLFPKFCGEWQTGDRGFLVMEYVPGTSLEKLRRQRRGIAGRQAMHIALELAEGLVYLHEQANPILYRDLKPHNVQIREDGQIKLLDFGCACHMTEERNVHVGTPGFAAPEQLAGKQADIAGDIYAFGRLLQYMLADCGSRPRGEEASLLAEIAEKCTREKKEERLGSMRLCIHLLSNRKIKKYVNKYIFMKDIWKKSGNYFNK